MCMRFNNLDKMEVSPQPVRVTDPDPWAIAVVLMPFGEFGLANTGQMMWFAQRLSRLTDWS